MLIFRFEPRLNENALMLMGAKRRINHSEPHENSEKIALYIAEGRSPGSKSRATVNVVQMSFVFGNVFLEYFDQYFGEFVGYINDMKRRQIDASQQVMSDSRGLAIFRKFGMDQRSNGFPLIPGQGDNHTNNSRRRVVRIEKGIQRLHFVGKFPGGKLVQ